MIRKNILLVKIAKFLGKFYTFQFNKKYSIGKYTYGNPMILYGEGADLKIGNYCSIAKGVIIYLGGNHNVDWITTYPFPEIFVENVASSKGDVIIGNDVWIGRNATILSGVKIGDGAIVGANSVVTKDVSPYSVVAGNPAKHLKYRFTEEVITELLRIKWWYWEHEEVLKHIDLLCSPNTDKFLKLIKNK